MKGSKELIRDTLLKLDGISDNDEWVDLVDRYELDCSPDHLRKLAYGFRMYRDIMGENSNETEELVKLKKERQKVSDLRVEANKQIRNLARIENVIDLMKDEINNLAKEKPIINDFKLPVNTSGKDGILVISDVHVGVTVKNPINEYNIDICTERLNKVIDKAIQHGLDNKIDKLHIVLNGDLISAELHSSIKLCNAENLVQQIVRASEMISQVIGKLSNFFYCTVTQNNGNHEAVDLIKDDRTNSNNYSMLLNEMIKLRTKHLPNVVFLDSMNNGEMSLMNVKGLNVISTHGDQITINKCVEQLAMATGVQPQIVLLSHYHQPKMISQYDCEIYINGSLVSTDNYAFKKKLYNPASQTMLIVTNEGVESSYVIKVH